MCSKDDPLKFVFWKKRLRDVREELKADALAKLKEQCPTLFAMGWFKVTERWKCLSIFMGLVGKSKE